MLRSIVFSFSFLFFYSIQAQIGFQKAQHLVEPYAEFHSMVVQDMDGDGYDDVVASAFSIDEGGIYLFLNDGSGNFGEPMVLGTQYAFQITSGDLDGDGDQDLACVSNSEVFTLLNDGNALFNLSHSGPLNDGRCVHLSDSDDDGDMDLFYCEGNQDSFSRLENDGSGNFSAPSLISNATTDVTDIKTADLDGDSDLDIIATSLNVDDVKWFRNDGNDQFSEVAQLTTTLVGAYSSIAADLDGDLDMDIATISFGSDNLVWFENTSGTFSAPQSISTQLDGGAELVAGDVDGDGDMDLLTGLAAGDEAILFLNDGSGQFTAQANDILHDNVQGVAIADMDSEMAMDLIVMSRGDNRLDWYAGNLSLEFSEKHRIARTASSSLRIELADIDQDGDVDILGLSPRNNTVALYENIGPGAYSPQQVIDEQSIGCTDLETGDMDGDGDLDILVVSSGDSTVAWYSRNALGEYGSRQIIAQGLERLRSCVLTDIDLDNDLDVVTIGRFSNHFKYWLNDGTGNFGSEHQWGTDLSGPVKVKAQDIDDNGHEDIVIAEEFGDKISVYFVGPELELSEKVTAISGLNGAYDMSFSDHDANGLLELQGCGIYDLRIRWTTYSPSGFGATMEMPFTLHGPASIVSSDLDDDGDEDLLISARSDNRINWIEYDSDSLDYMNKYQVKSVYERPNDAQAADLDGDGDMDVVSAYLHTVGVFHGKLYAPSVECTAFGQAPTDLTKSFDPVHGVQDRVQVKWYKDAPQIKYSDADAAACDIEFWPIKNLDPVTGAVISDILDGDSLMIMDAKKNYPDNSPRSIFKWPLKFRVLGAGQENRVEPNTRYNWRVRCACEQGLGPESDWSEIKIFNTPDFNDDGIYIDNGLTKNLDQETGRTWYQKDMIKVEVSAGKQAINYRLFDISGRVLEEGITREEYLEIHTGNLSPGVYLLQLGKESLKLIVD